MNQMMKQYRRIIHTFAKVDGPYSLVDIDVFIIDLFPLLLSFFTSTAMWSGSDKILVY